MALISEPQCRQTPHVFNFGIKADRICLPRKAGRVTEYGHRAIEILGEGFLEFCAPARHIGRQGVQRERDGIKLEAGIDSTSAIEATLGIGIIEILHEAGHTHTLEFVEGVLECPKSHATEIEHEILPDKSAGIRQALWKQIRFRHQKQARRLRPICANYYSFRSL